MQYKEVLVAIWLFIASGFISDVSANPLLSEVLYDPSGSDSGHEWVELYNPTAVAINLNGYSLGWGGNDYFTRTAQLSGTILPGDYFVIGGPNGGISYDLVLDFSPDIQNSGSIADGIALFDVMAGDIMADTIPVDAVIYGTANSNGLIDASGIAGLPHVTDVASGNSIERITLMGAWQPQSNPTPGSGLFSLPSEGGVTGQVPEPPMLWLMAVGLVGMFGASRRARI